MVKSNAIYDHGHLPSVGFDSNDLTQTRSVIIYNSIAAATRWKSRPFQWQYLIFEKFPARGA